jgi:hypothetical protein
MGRAWIAIEGDHQVTENITANPKDDWDIARNVGKLTIEDEPQTRKGEKLDLDLVTPGVERDDSLCRNSS